MIDTFFDTLVYKTLQHLDQHSSTCTQEVRVINTSRANQVIHNWWLNTFAFHHLASRVLRYVRPLRSNCERVLIAMVRANSFTHTFICFPFFILLSSSISLAFWDYLPSEHQLYSNIWLRDLFQKTPMWGTLLRLFKCTRQNCIILMFQDRNKRYFFCIYLWRNIISP